MLSRVCVGHLAFFSPLGDHLVFCSISARVFYFLVTNVFSTDISHCLSQSTQLSFHIKCETRHLNNLKEILKYSLYVFNGLLFKILDLKYFCLCHELSSLY